jgi:hypothetical protein
MSPPAGPVSLHRERAMSCGSMTGRRVIDMPGASHERQRMPNARQLLEQPML